MFIVAIGPESHNLVVDDGNGRVLDDNAERLGDGVRQRVLGNCTSYRAGYGAKQSEEKAG